MHPNISVAVPTRHRHLIINKFIDSLFTSISVTTAQNNKIPFLTILHDSPDNLDNNECVEDIDDIAAGCDNFRSVLIPEKSSLTELWNLSIMLSPTDWVFLCNDDIIFKPGWLEYLEEKIEEDKYLLVHLFHYGAMLFHKSLILKVGWFDERFRGGGYEDNDYQLRISEANLKDKVDRSHDFIRREGGREIGHFIDHLKYEYKGENWQGENNYEWCSTKWGNGCNWRLPAIRQSEEIDWHPRYTSRYNEKFRECQKWQSIGRQSMVNCEEIFH